MSQHDGFAFHHIHPDQDTDWMNRAACAGAPTSVFFPGRGELSDRDRVPRAAAKLCARCPVKAECLDFAIVTRSLGVWGGESDKARKLMRRNRRKIA